ncbi:MAG: hypothetical protein R3321_09455, partial [Nitrososphaeraceae archaeon]|nr:hypothetical protein [Nitrososphaeraceae archaeon]
MISLKENIINIARKIAVDENLLLIDVIVRGHEKSRVIEIFIDGKEAVSAETCAAFSRKIIKIIEDEDIISSGFRLDVSTPGVERPLKFIEQFYKHLNRNFEVKYKSGDSVVKFSGKLIEIIKNELTFKNDRELLINFKNI